MVDQVQLVHKVTRQRHSPIAGFFLPAALLQGAEHHRLVLLIELLWRHLEAFTDAATGK